MVQKLEKSAAEIIAKFDNKDPASSVVPLLKLRRELAVLADKHQHDSIIEEKRAQLDSILQGCLGLQTETTIDHSDVVPGEPMKLHISASVSSKLPDNLQVRWLSVGIAKSDDNTQVAKRTLKSHAINVVLSKPHSFETTEVLPSSTPLTQPYWLRADGTPGMFHVDEPKLIGTAENAPSFPIDEVFEVGGQTLIVHDEPVQVTTDSLGNQIRRRLDVIPPVSLRCVSDVVVMTPGSSRSVAVEVKAFRANSNGSLELEAPSGWKIEPAKQSFNLATAGKVLSLLFPSLHHRNPILQKLPLRR